MIFLGTTFFGGKHTFEPVAENGSNITKISLSNGIFDKLFVSRNTDLVSDNFSDDWDENTVLSANFDYKLEAGNSNFSLRNTDTVIIKRRELLKDKWITIYTKAINKLEDFKITFVDKYAKSNTDYIYRISSTANGIENSYTECRVHSSFDGMYIVDKDNIYGTIYNVGDNNTTLNVQSQLATTYNKYPTINSNSEISYESGSASGVFIKLDLSNGETVDLGKSSLYREEFKNRLASHKPFILKMPDGRLWMANVTGNISESREGHDDVRSISFEWSEIGDYNDMKTLYNNNLSDVDSKWW